MRTPIIHRSSDASGVAPDEPLRSRVSRLNASGGARVDVVLDSVVDIMQPTRLDAVSVVEDEVRELVRRRGLDPVADRAAVRRLVDEVVADYDERALTAACRRSSTRGRAARAVSTTRWPGSGRCSAYLDDPTVEEIWINEPGRVFVARHGRSELTTTILDDGRGPRPRRADAEDQPGGGSTCRRRSSTRCCRTAAGCTS